MQPCSCFRLDVTKIDPEALVGRTLRVYWPDDDGWYLGRVAQYSPQTGQHQVLLCPASVCLHACDLTKHGPMHVIANGLRHCSKRSDGALTELILISVGHMSPNFNKATS